MDATLGQILSYLFQLQGEIDRLKTENNALKQALDDRQSIPRIEDLQTVKSQDGTRTRTLIDHKEMK